MHSSPLSFVQPPTRYSAKNMSKPVNFVLLAPEAKHVTLAGDFNDWVPNSHPMSRQPDGAWFIQMPLSHGHHHYHFIVDGKPRLDPRAHGVARNHNGQRVSLVAVS